MTAATPPDHVVVAGDWHGNTDWALNVIEEIPRLLPSEEHRIVLHTGDFGIWPGGVGYDYVDAVRDALAAVDAQLWFVDGNHEDHDQLAQQLAFAGGDRQGLVGGFDRPGRDTRVWWLPRGLRWTWHDRTWLALGGAVSVDHAVRVPGRSWWAAERLSLKDCAAATSPGHADVVLAHDCPSLVPLPLPRPAPGFWDIPAADAHRAVLQSVVDRVTPTHLIHGHYHLAHRTVVEMNHGPVEVTGLDCDDAAYGNVAVLDVRSMTWATS